MIVKRVQSTNCTKESVNDLSEKVKVTLRNGIQMELREVKEKEFTILLYDTSSDGKRFNQLRTMTKNKP